MGARGGEEGEGGCLYFDVDAFFFFEGSAVLACGGDLGDVAFAGWHGWCVWCVWGVERVCGGRKGAWKYVRVRG